MPAAPTLQACANGGTGSGGAAATVVWTVPTVQTGDYGILITAQSGGIAVSTVSDGAATWSVITPGTWPLVNGNGINATGYSAPLTPADSGATLTLTWSGTQRAAGLLVIVRGSAQRVDVVATAQRTVSTTNTAVAGPAYTPIGNNALALAFVQCQSFANGTLVTVTPAAAYTEPTNGDVSTSPAAAICVGTEVAWKALSGQAGVSQSAFAATSDVASARNNAIVLVIPPIDPPPPVGRRRSAQPAARRRVSPSPTPTVVAVVTPTVQQPRRPRIVVQPTQRRKAPVYVPQAPAILAVPPAQPMPARRRQLMPTGRRKGTVPVPVVVPLLEQPVQRRRPVAVLRRRTAQVPVAPVADLQPPVRRRPVLVLRRRVISDVGWQQPAPVVTTPLPPQPVARRARAVFRRPRPVVQVPPAAPVVASSWLPQPARTAKRLVTVLARRVRPDTGWAQPPTVTPTVLVPQPTRRPRGLPAPVRRRATQQLAPVATSVPQPSRTRRTQLTPRRRGVVHRPVAPAVQPPLPPQPPRRALARLWRRLRPSFLVPAPQAAPPVVRVIDWHAVPAAPQWTVRPAGPAWVITGGPTAWQARPAGAAWTITPAPPQWDADLEG